MLEISSRQITLIDSFWSPRLEVNARSAVFHQWEQLEASRCIDNFRLAAGEKEGFRQGWFFADSDAYKWLEAASRVYATHPDPALKSLIDNFIALLRKVQSPDGYLFTYNQLLFPGRRWVVLQIEHELYCHGHLIEAGVSHYEATAERPLLEVAIQAADLLVRDFLNSRPEMNSGHEEIEVALLRLYRLTQQENYLQLAQEFLEKRGRIPAFSLHLLGEFIEHNHRNRQVAAMHQSYLSTHPDQQTFQIPAGNYAKKPQFTTLRWYLNALRGYYAQQHTPIRRQTFPAGHAVRFGYLETAQAMLQRLRPETGLLGPLEQAWEHMVTRRMYVTGGLGSLPGIEGFGADFELDPEFAYAETCAALASMFWSWEMAQLTGKAQYSDLFEWQLYNAASVGMGASGDRYLYNNPLVCRGGITRKAWYAVPCCPSNLSRTWANLSRYLLSVDEGSLWIHQYWGSRAVDLILGQAGTPTSIEIHSGLPWAGRVRIQVDPADPTEFDLHLRLPSWAGEQSSATVNGESVSLAAAPAGLDQTACSYDPRLARWLTIPRRWSPGDVVELSLDMPVQVHRAHPRLRGHKGKVALSRGPLVYCLESVDNPDVDIFAEPVDPTTLIPEPEPDLLGGIWVLRGRNRDGKPVTAIPFALWANRGESQMTVWVQTE